MQWCVIDADGKHVCECDGEDDGRVEAARIVRAVNLTYPTLLQQAQNLYISVTMLRTENKYSEARIERVRDALRVRVVRRSRGKA